MPLRRHEFNQRSTLLEDRRRGAARGSFSVGDSLVGESGADTSTAHGEQVQAVYAERCKGAEAGAVLAEGARAERASDCGPSAEGRPCAPGGQRKRGGHWFALTAIAREAEILFGAGGARGRHIGWVSERAGTFADERLGGNASSTGAGLQDQHP